MLISPQAAAAYIRAWASKQASAEAASYAGRAPQFSNHQKTEVPAHCVDLVDRHRRGGTTAGLPQLYLPGTYRDEGRRGASQGPSEVDPSVGRFAQAPSEVGPDIFSSQARFVLPAHALSNELTRSRTVLHDLDLQCSSLGAAALHPALTKARWHCSRS
jgi:hypothetical protein